MGIGSGNGIYAALGEDELIKHQSVMIDLFP